ncbi:hypothetical protein ACJX0J_040980, partial [Zea mays]
GGIVQALSTRNRWNGYSMDYQGKNKLVFSLTDPKSCTAQGRDCTIVDCTRKIVAQMGKKELMGGKDFYHVEVQSGYDQAFIIGVMAILDSIHGERHGTNRRHLKLSKADASRGYLLSENTQVSQLPACR